MYVASRCNRQRRAHFIALSSAMSRSSVDRLIAYRLPVQDQIPFFTATRGLTRRTIMGMNAGCAVLNGVIQPHAPFEPLVQIARLSNVDRNPTPILGLFGIDVIAGQWPERSLKRKDLV